MFLIRREAVLSDTPSAYHSVLSQYIELQLPSTPVLGCVSLDVYYVTDVIIKISVRDVIIKGFLRSIQLTLPYDS